MADLSTIYILLTISQIMVNLTTSICKRILVKEVINQTYSNRKC
jgi:hypothetical protein